MKRVVLLPDQIAAIRKMIAMSVTNTDIARKFGVSHSMISLIKLGKNWAPHSNG